MNMKLPKKIGTAFIYTCMGFGDNEPDAKSVEMVKNCSELVLASANPQVEYKRLPLARLQDTKEIGVLTERNLLEGKNIYKHLEGCQECILMAVTLGGQLDKLIRRAEVTDMVKAIALDACASSLVEDLCDQLNSGFSAEYEKEGLYLTERFSPGYGDWPLEGQNIFSALLEMEKKMGLTQNSQHLLIPRKSVTAIIGLMDKEEWEKRQQERQEVAIKSETEKGSYEEAMNTALSEDNEIACRVCARRRNCSFRATGGHCGRK